MTTITLDQQFAFSVARLIAEQIHSEFIHRHLRRCGHADRHDSTIHNRIPEVRAMIKSISGEGSMFSNRRLEFIYSVRYHLREIMKERRDQPRWQLYVASVAELNGLPHPGHPDAPGWSTFVLKERRAA